MQEGGSLRPRKRYTCHNWSTLLKVQYFFFLFNLDHLWADIRLWLVLIRPDLADAGTECKQRGKCAPVKFFLKFAKISFVGIHLENSLCVSKPHDDVCYCRGQ